MFEENTWYVKIYVLYSVSCWIPVPPEIVQIRADGRDVKSVIGPYREGDMATLTCTARGGRY